MAEQISNFLGSINWPVISMPRIGLNSILDIAFITFVMYKLLMWIKQTRAWTLFKGVIMLAMIYLGATLLGMDTTTWIIDQGLMSAVIVTFIIFQPELRKALERLGKGQNIPFIGTLEESDGTLDKNTVDEIITATMKMSAVKTGALIVVEQQVALGDFEGSGVKIDAMVTSQLLLSIFEHTTPLHDGAVMVRGNRAKAASCILPLTSNLISQDLGTRHRAAVGISETSDAYALVVSEETGAISIAKEGKLYRNLSESEIRSMLVENLKPARARIFRPSKSEKRKSKGGRG